MGDYEDGFRDGFTAAYYEALDFARKVNRPTTAGTRIPEGVMELYQENRPRKKSRKKSSGRKRRQSPKQKLLTEMTAKKWRTYSKGKGRKTYVQIRAEVSRSQAFKRRAKKL